MPDPRVPNQIYAGTTIGLYRSQDGGESWKSELPDLVINAIVVDPENSDILLLGTDDAGVLRSEDGGRSFTPSNAGFSQRQVSSTAVRKGTREEYFAAVTLDAHHGGFFATRDGGVTWEVFNEGLPKAATGGIKKILAAQRSSDVFLATTDGLYIGVPDRSSWTLAGGTSKLFINDIQFLDEKETKLLLAAKQGIFRYDVPSTSLDKLRIPVYEREFFATWSDTTRNWVFVGTDNGVYLSQDFGETWAPRMDGLPYSPIKTIRGAGEHLFCGTRNGLYFSDNSGETWQQTQGVFPLEIGAIELSSGSAQEVYAADLLVGYLFASQDGGRNWSNYELGLALSRISSLSTTQSGDLLAGTVSEGVILIAPPRENRAVLARK
jgi:photosystem II stability/assembly factor-like uncharacterized protein